MELNTTPRSSFWKDVNGVYLGCNQVLSHAAGLDDPDLVIGKTDYDLPWPKEEAVAYRADDREVVNLIDPNSISLNHCSRPTAAGFG